LQENCERVLLPIMPFHKPKIVSIIHLKFKYKHLIIKNIFGMGNLQTNNIIKNYNSQTCQVLSFYIYS
jgi:hypothetical protein